MWSLNCFMQNSRLTTFNNFAYSGKFFFVSKDIIQIIIISLFLKFVIFKCHWQILFDITLRLKLFTSFQPTTFSSCRQHLMLYDLFHIYSEFNPITQGYFPRNSHKCKGWIWPPPLLVANPNSGFCSKSARKLEEHTNHVPVSAKWHV